MLALVQHSSNSGHGVDLITKSYASGATINNLLVVAAANGAANTLSISDTLNNTWTANINNFASGSANIYVWSCINRASGPNTVTVTGGTAQDYDLQIYEVSGNALSGVLDASGTAVGTGGTPSVSTSGATTNANDWVFAFVFNFNADVTFTAGSGYTLEENTHNTTGVQSTGGEDKIVSSTGVQSATMTGVGPSDLWLAAILAFKGAASGATPISASDDVLQLSPRPLPFSSCDFQDGAAIRVLPPKLDGDDQHKHWPAMSSDSFRAQDAQETSAAPIVLPRWDGSDSHRDYPALASDSFRAQDAQETSAAPIILPRWDGSDPHRDYPALASSGFAAQDAQENQAAPVVLPRWDGSDSHQDYPAPASASQVLPAEYDDRGNFIIVVPPPITQGWDAPDDMRTLPDNTASLAEYDDRGNFVIVVPPPVTQGWDAPDDVRTLPDNTALPAEYEDRGNFIIVVPPPLTQGWDGEIELRNWQPSQWPYQEEASVSSAPAVPLVEALDLSVPAAPYFVLPEIEERSNLIILPPPPPVTANWDEQWTGPGASVAPIVWAGVVWAGLDFDPAITFATVGASVFLHYLQVSASQKWTVSGVAALLRLSASPAVATSTAAVASSLRFSGSTVGRATTTVNSLVTVES